MKKIFALSAVILIGFGSAAIAGSSTLKKNGKSMSLCCYTAERISAFKKGPAKRIGNGGSANYQAHKRKFKKSGWK